MAGADPGPAATAGPLDLRTTPVGWQARLDLDYQRRGEATRRTHRHHGPLRVLKSLYPEGAAVCHDVLVHPPSGLVGGDHLALTVAAGSGAHAVLTTPGATRYYRSDGPAARQEVHLRLDAGARLEWLPLESIAYPGCRAHNTLTLDLQAGAECLGWDVVALGLNRQGEPFPRGRYEQHLHWPGVWLERGLLSADDRALMDGPGGLAGYRCLSMLFLARCGGWSEAQRERLLDLARGAIDATDPRCAGQHGTPPPHKPTLLAGATAPHAELLLVRALSHRVEPAFGLLRTVRGLWRQECWGLASTPLRLWAM